MVFCILHSWLRTVKEPIYKHMGIKNAVLRPLLSLFRDIFYPLSNGFVHLVWFLICYVQDIPGGKVSILGGHSISHSKQKFMYLSYSKWFPR
jgi:hypothetical protein